jgi:predicted ribosome quality control (RQC) complex YloA/Tae2 family protein
LEASFETLGSIGFKGLLSSEFKLDGRKQPPPAPPPDAQLHEGEKKIHDINTSMEQLMQSLGIDKTKNNENDQYYIDNDVEQSIPQITNKLQADMLEFKFKFLEDEKLALQLEKEQKERDELMKEEGRRQERERKLLELDLPATNNALEFFGCWDGEQYLPDGNNIDYSQAHRKKQNLVFVF